MGHFESILRSYFTKFKSFLIHQIVLLFIFVLIACDNYLNGSNWTIENNNYNQQIFVYKSNYEITFIPFYPENPMSYQYHPYSFYENPYTGDLYL